MRKFAFTILSVVSVSVALYFAAAMWYVPKAVEKLVLEEFSKSTYSEFSYKEQEIGHGKILFQDLSLDESGFNTIKSIEIRYSALDYLTKGGRVSRVKIEGLQLTGSFPSQHSSHVTALDTAIKLLNALRALPAEKVLIVGAHSDVMSDELGGLRFDFDLSLTRKINGDTSVQGRLETQQKSLSLAVKIEGTVGKTGNMEINATGQNIQVETDDLKLSRTNIEASLYAIPDVAPSFSLQASAGAMTWRRLPLRDVNITYELSPKSAYILSEGRTIGKESIEFTANMVREDGQTYYEASIQPPTFEDMISYLKGNGKLGHDIVFPALFLRLNEPTLTLSTKIPNDSTTLSMIDFQVSGQRQLFSLDGKINIDYDGQRFSGNFTMPSSLVTDEAVDIFAEEIDGELPDGFPPRYAPRRIDPEHIDDLSLKSSVVADSSGRFGGTLSPEGKMLSLSWDFGINIRDGILRFGPFGLGGISGQVKDISGQVPKIKTEEIIRRNFKLPLRSSIPYEGFIDFSMPQPSSRKLMPENIRLNIYDGYIDTGPISMHENRFPEELIVEVSDIALAPFFKDAGLDKAQITGKMGGRLPLTQEGNSVLIKDGLLQSQGGGILMIPESVTKAIFPGDSEQMVTIRNALRNYHYEYFEIRLDGDLTKRVMMTMSANGANPDYLKGRQIELSLQIETQIGLVFDQLIKK